jgi:hypothetical protein
MQRYNLEQGKRIYQRYVISSSFWRYCHWVALLGMVVVLTACDRLGNMDGPRIKASGVVKSETRAVSGFTAIDLSAMGEMVVEQTGSESLTIEADDNVLPLISSEVKDGTLVIKFKDNTPIDNPTRLRLTVTVEELTSVVFSGAGTMILNQLRGNSLSITLSGAGSIQVSGEVTDQKVNVSGAGKYEGGGLSSKTAAVTVRGVGTVEYIGNPRVNKNVSGIGIVKQRSY